MEHDLVIRVTLLVALAASALNALEVLGSAGDYQPTGALSWHALSRQRSWTRSGPLAPALNAIFGPNGYLLLNLAQLLVVCAIACMALVPLHLPGPGVRAISYLPLLWLLLIFEVFSDFRNRTLGRDGSDRMHLVVLVAITLCCSFTDSRAQSLALAFVALQVMLAYLTSGVVKAVAPRWRSGAAFATVLLSENYGARKLGLLAVRWPSVARLAAWLVIGFELSFPSIVLLGPRPTLILLAAGLFFHLGIAATMGLNGFVWTFAATYPAVYWLSGTVHHALLAPR